MSSEDSEDNDEPESKSAVTNLQEERAPAKGLRGLAARHPNVTIFVIVFGSLGGLILLQLLL